MLAMCEAGRVDKNYGLDLSKQSVLIALGSLLMQHLFS